MDRSIPNWLKMALRFGIVPAWGRTPEEVPTARAKADPRRLTKERRKQSRQDRRKR